MIVVYIGAGVAGAMTGIVATAVFAYFARELLLHNRFRVRHGTAVIVLLFGGRGQVLLWVHTSSTNNYGLGS
jgi:hypothetical protein